MRKRFGPFLGFTALIVIAIIIWELIPSESDPVFNHQTVSAWVDHAIAYYPYDEQFKEVAAAHPHEVAAILIKRLHAKYNPLREPYIKFRERFSPANPPSLTSVESPPAEIVRARAALLVSQLKPAIKDAVPALYQLAQNDPHSDTRFAALSALGRMGSTALETAPGLMTILQKDHDSNIRGGAAIALTKIKPDPALGVPAFIKALDDSDLAVRNWSTFALGNYGAKAKDAIPKLEHLAGSQNASATEAAKALKKINDAIAAETLPK